MVQERSLKIGSQSTFSNVPAIAVLPRQEDAEEDEPALASGSGASAPAGLNRSLNNLYRQPEEQPTAAAGEASGDMAGLNIGETTLEAAPTGQATTSAQAVQQQQGKRAGTPSRYTSDAVAYGCNGGRKSNVMY